MDNNLYKLVPIMGTIMESKEPQVLELFFNYPTKEWHFEEILKSSKIARSKVDRWLKKLIKEQLIQRIKPRGEMPHYIGYAESAEYHNRKMIYALEQLHKTGLLNHLSSLKKAKAVILFGSFSRSDWNQDSDIDIFIYGEPDGLKIAPYELKLHRDLELFICKNNDELKTYNEGLLKNIIRGHLIKGNLDFIQVKTDA
jgi:predicted nucleotidyltransferase